VIKPPPGAAAALGWRYGTQKIEVKVDCQSWPPILDLRFHLHGNSGMVPARQLRRRLELLSGWFPTGRGHKLYRAPTRNGGV
jgi:hypothetical protein